MVVIWQKKKICFTIQYIEFHRFINSDNCLYINNKTPIVFVYYILIKQFQLNSCLITETLQVKDLHTADPQLESYNHKEILQRNKLELKMHIEVRHKTEDLQTKYPYFKLKTERQISCKFDATPC